MPPPSLSVQILYNKSNTFGLVDDLVVIERLLKSISQSAVSGVTFQKPRLLDAREPLTPADVQIHLEVPIYGAIPWAHVNIMLVNPDHWVESAYDVYAPAFDFLLFRASRPASLMGTRLAASGILSEAEAEARIVVLPWCSSWELREVPRTVKRNEFIAFVGGSENKASYLVRLLPLWRPSYPPLTIYTTRVDLVERFRQVMETMETPPANVFLQHIDLDGQKQRTLAASYAGHLCVSTDEGFGYVAAHAEMAGAFCIMNRLPVYRAQYDGDSHVAWLPPKADQLQQEDLDKAIAEFLSQPSDVVYQARTARAKGRMAKLTSAFLDEIPAILRRVKERRPAKGVVHLPPILDLSDCPSITIVTPTYNRRRLFEIAFHNMLSTDYPRDKMEWIVIEDNEKAPHLIGNEIAAFQVKIPEVAIKYIPIEGRMTIGEKRNHAIQHASHDIVLFMDDDDHYPVTSFRRRVAWLVKGRMSCGRSPRIVCCTTIALYDLMQGTSAVNVPPLDLPLAQRISEATLTFYKSAWTERPFPQLSVAEGEAWIKGREHEVLEIPPQQIIVAFSHGKNQSSRRLPPAGQTPSCFWGFPKEYLIFVHGLVGVGIEEADEPKKSGGGVNAVNGSNGRHRRP